MNASRLIDEEAAAWVVRLGGPALTEAEQRAFADWTRRSPEHAARLAHARATWTALAHLRLAATADPPPARSLDRTPRRHMVQAAAAVLLAAGGTAWVHGGGNRADHRTERGEVRRIALPDGSTVVLAARSAIAVRFGAGARDVDLLDGEALFAPAAATAAGPFTVHAGRGRIRALGTRFTVSARTRGFDVAVLEHGVEVSLDRRDPVVVRQAQGLHFDEAGIGTPYAVDPARQAAWAEGRLVFDRMTLADVVEVLNRYRRGRIVIASSALASRRISGVFRTDLPEEALQVIVDGMHARSLALPLGTTVIF